MEDEKKTFEEGLEVIRSLNKENSAKAAEYGHDWKNIVYNINCAVLIWFNDVSIKERCLPLMNKIGLFRSSSNVSIMGWSGLNAKQIHQFLMEEAKLNSEDFDIRGSYLLLREK